MLFRMAEVISKTKFCQMQVSDRFARFSHGPFLKSNSKDIRKNFSDTRYMKQEVENLTK